MNPAVLLFVLVALCHSSIIVGKTYSLDKGTTVPTVGKDVVITIQVFNTGASVLSEIEFSDKWNKDEFLVVAGISSGKWAELAPGHNLTHSYVVRPLKAGDLVFKRTEVAYRDARDGKVHSAQSTGYWGSEKGQVVLWSEADQRSGHHLREWIVFAVICVALLATPGGYYYFLTTTYPEGLKAKSE